MRRKPPPKSFWSFWYDPAFDIDATHLDEIAQIAGPEAKILIETKHHELEGIEELRKVVHARTRLDDLTLKLGHDVLQIVPDLRAYGPKAKELEPAVSLIRNAARRRFGLRAAATSVAMGVWPWLLLSGAEIFGRARGRCFRLGGG